MQNAVQVVSSYVKKYKGNESFKFFNFTRIPKDYSELDKMGFILCSPKIPFNLSAFRPLDLGLSKLISVPHDLPLPQHCLYFLPLPHGHGAFLLIFLPALAGIDSESAFGSMGF